MNRYRPRTALLASEPREEVVPVRHHMEISSEYVDQALDRHFLRVMASTEQGATISRLQMLLECFHHIYTVPSAHENEMATFDGKESIPLRQIKPRLDLKPLPAVIAPKADEQPLLDPIGLPVHDGPIAAGAARFIHTMLSRCPGSRRRREPACQAGMAA